MKINGFINYDLSIYFGIISTILLIKELIIFFFVYHVSRF